MPHRCVAALMMLMLCMRGINAAETSADELFRLGRQAFEAGQYTSACKYFRESLEKDDKAGTLNALARCEEQLGRIATADALYSKYVQRFLAMSPADQARHKERYEHAKSSRAKLEAEIPRITLVAVKDLPPGSRLQLDSIELSVSSLNTERPIDPGDHTLTLSTPNQAVARKSFTIARRENIRMEVPILEQPAPPSNTTRAQPPPSGSTTSQGLPPLSSAAPSTMSLTKDIPSGKVGRFIGLGVSGAVLAAGAIAGIVVLARASEIQTSCPDNRCRDDSATKFAKDTQNLALLSTIAFGVGGAGGVVFGIMLLAEPSKPKEGAPPKSFGYGDSPTLLGASVQAGGTF